MQKIHGVAVLCSLMLGACHSGDLRSVDAAEPPDVSPGPGPTANDSDRDFSKAVWRIAPVHVSPSTISNGATIAFTADGQGHVVWGEPDSSNVSDQDLMSVALGSSGSAQLLTNDTRVQNAFAQLVARGNVLHLMYYGYPGGDPDVFYVQAENGVWSSPMDLTSVFESEGVRRDYGASLAFNAAGERAIAYLSEGATKSPAEVRVLFFDHLGPKGPPVTILPAVGDGCDHANAAFDKRGKLHVVAACGVAFNQSLFYATNMEGTWTSSALPRAPDEADSAPSMAPSTDGETFHLVFTRTKPCTIAGSQPCNATYYSRVGPGVPQAPLGVTDLLGLDAFNPVVGVDSEDRIFIAQQVFNGSRMAELYVSWSDKNGLFSKPKNLTPGNVTTDDWNPGAWAFDQNGLPHLVFERLHETTEPLNADVMHAYVEGFSE